MNYFDSPFVGKPLKDQITNPNIIAGEYSYYSGYYHGHSFDECVRYLAPDRDDVDRLIVGKFCSIGSGAVFMMAGNQGHRIDWISTFPFHYSNDRDFCTAKDGFMRAGDTIIGNDVWIGSEAMIMPGIIVGNGAVVASRALVTRNVAPYTVVGGSPAKPIKTRFSAEEIGLLLEMEWWDWSREEIVPALALLTSGNVRELYDYWKKLRT